MACYPWKWDYSHQTSNGASGWIWIFAGAMLQVYQVVLKNTVEQIHRVERPFHCCCFDPAQTIWAGVVVGVVSDHQQILHLNWSH